MTDDEQEKTRLKSGDFKKECLKKKGLKKEDSKKRVLIITRHDDIHADTIIPVLIEKGCNPFRVNLEDFPRAYQIQQQYQNGEYVASLTHIPSLDSLLTNEIGAVWLRRKADFSFLSDDLNPQEKAFAEEEAEHTLFGFFHSLDCYWMSHPLAIRSALWKGEQLLRAVRFGFKIPDSLISNNPDSVKYFKDNINGDLVYKTMSSPQLAADKVAKQDIIAHGVPTTLITDELMENIGAVSELPCCFQEYIPKQYELRVTVIGDQAFAAKIHSQDDDRTKTDFRDFSAEILYEATELPVEIKQRCIDFVHSYGLNFGALDIIVTPDDEYVFLENNPGGQFLFIEQLVPELKMMDAMAECLMTGT